MSNIISKHLVQHSYASLNSLLETFSCSPTNVHAFLTYKTKWNIVNVIFAECKYDLYENLWMLRLWEFWEWSSSLTHLFPWAHALTVSFSIFYYFLCELIFILLCWCSVVFVWWMWTFGSTFVCISWFMIGNVFMFTDQCTCMFDVQHKITNSKCDICRM